MAGVIRPDLLFCMNPGHTNEIGNNNSIGEQKTDVHGPVSRSYPVTGPIRDREGQPPHILVVDDDGDIRRLWARALIRSGYKVDTAEDGATGWQAIDARTYSLLITDDDMPKLSGIDLVKKIRSAGMDLPVVLASVANPMEKVNQDPSLQLAAVLPKVCTHLELLNAVKEALTNKIRP